MYNKVNSVKLLPTIIFSNGDEYEIPCVNKDYMVDDLKTFCTSVKLDENLYASSSSNIVGNICGNTLDLEIMSYDQLLVSTNDKSPYFGYMNDTALVSLKAYIEDDDIVENMGVYFVSAWDCGADADTLGEVSISCVDLMSKIKNISLKNIRLRNNIKFNDYLKVVIDTLNKELPDHMKILYNDDDLNIFKNSRYDWEMYFNNIDRDDIESIFNTIAKDTISYIWIDRDQHLKTDHLLDDIVYESVCELSGSVQLFNYGVQSGGIDSYSGVSVQYIEDILYEDKQVLKLSKYHLEKGDNAVLNQTLNSNSVYKINLIEIICDDGSYAYCYSQDFYKNKINLYIESESRTEADIVVYGTVMNESYNTIDRFSDYLNKNNRVQILNRVLYKGYINTYVDGLINLMSSKKGLMYAEGYINPRIRLGDTVHLQGSKLGVSDFYKVIGLSFTFGTSYRCVVTLLKVMNTRAHLNDVLLHNHSVFHRMLMGEPVHYGEYTGLNEKDNEVVETDLHDELVVWRGSLYGGA